MSGKQEIIRQLVHLIFGLAILLLNLMLEKSIVTRIMLILFLIFVLLSLLHLKRKVRWLDKISREHDKKFPLKGPIFFIVGSVLVILLFPKDIALASIAVLTFGDCTSTLADFFGVKYKINPFRKFKSLLGTVCGIVVSFFFALLFVSPLLALCGSVVGMLSETLAIKLGETNADDNLIIPLAAGTAMYFLAKII